MDREVVKKAGYDYHGNPSYWNHVDKLEWSDCHDLIEVGNDYKPGDEYFDPYKVRWEEVTNISKITGGTYLIRRVKPGFERIRAFDERRSTEKAPR